MAFSRLLALQTTSETRAVSHGNARILSNSLRDEAGVWRPGHFEGVCSQAQARAFLSRCCMAGCWKSSTWPSDV